jgi:hypothetical protein
MELVNIDSVNSVPSFLLGHVADHRLWPESVAELLIVYDVKRHHKFFDSIIMVAIKVQF